MSEKLSLTVLGMKCGGCEAHLKSTLLAVDGVLSVEATHQQNKVDIEFETANITPAQLHTAIMAAGYQVE